jgi:hypothetical protein
VLAHSLNPSTQEVEAGGSLSLGPVYRLESDLYDSKNCRETLSPKPKKKKEERKKTHQILAPVFK